MSPLFPKINDTKKKISLAYKVPKPRFDPLPDMPAMEHAGTTAEMEGTPGPRLSLDVKSIAKEDCIPVDSVEEAENVLLQHATEKTFTHNGEVNSAFLSIVIARLANKIAQASRRGGGNIVLMNPDDGKLLSGDYFEEERETVGRWQRIGRLHHLMNIYTCDVIPSGTLYVAFSEANAALDGAGCLVEFDDHLFLSLADNTTGEDPEKSDSIMRATWN